MTFDAAALARLRVLVVHEWLYTWAGAERVLEQILEIFPRADLLVGVVHDRMRDHNEVTRRARETWVGRIPGARSRHRLFLPAHALAFATYDTSGYDLVISSSHAFEKCIRARRGGAVHVCYCHTPPRYLWDQQGVYAEHSNLAGRIALSAAAPMLRAIDRRGAQGVDRFVVNSQYVGERVRRYYGRGSEIVYPPVSPKAGGRRETVDRLPFLLHLGRLVEYKRADLVIAAAENMGMRLVIAGAGPARSRLERLAGRFTEFLGEVSEAQAGELLSSCSALVFAGEEDFGISLVEANAHGRPVVCYAAGGALESMVPGTTAVLFARQEVNCIVEAIQACLATDWDLGTLRRNAERFSPATFRARFAAVISDALGRGARSNADGADMPSGAS